MVKPTLTSMFSSPDLDALSPGEEKLLRLFKDCAPLDSVEMAEMKEAFDNIEELEQAQVSLKSKGFLVLIDIPNFPWLTDKVLPARVTLDGVRRLAQLSG